MSFKDTLNEYFTVFADIILKIGSGNKMDKFMGKWSYLHQFADRDNIPFLNSIGVPKEFQEKVLRSGINLLHATTDGTDLLWRLETSTGQRIQENKFKLGERVKIKTPDGREAEGKYIFVADRISAEFKIKGVDAYFTKMMEVKDDLLIMTYELPALDMKTVARFERVHET